MKKSYSKLFNHLRQSEGNYNMLPIDRLYLKLTVIKYYFITWKKPGMLPFYHIGLTTWFLSIFPSSLFTQIKNGEGNCVPSYHKKRETGKGYYILSTPLLLKNSAFPLSLASPIFFCFIIIQKVNIKINNHRTVVW